MRPSRKRFLFRASIVLIPLFLMSTDVAQGADIRLQPKAKAYNQDGDSVEIDVISVFGGLRPGDADKFLRLTAEIRNAAILLESPGGSVTEGLPIGQRIHVRQYTTIAVGECSSMCGLVWLAGAYRIIEKGARVGFHAAYLTTGGEVKVSGGANAQIGAYLYEIGVDPRGIADLAKTDPHKMLWIDDKLARKIGKPMEAR